MKNENQPKQDSGSPSRSLNCSADGHGGNAKRFTPEQRADAVIQILYTGGGVSAWFELRDNIAAEIREAVEVERQICSMMANHFSKELEKRIFTDDSFRESIAIMVYACNGD